jgi:hypothetical protein
MSKRTVSYIYDDTLDGELVAQQAMHRHEDFGVQDEGQLDAVATNDRYAMLSSC